MAILKRDAPPSTGKKPRGWIVVQLVTLFCQYEEPTPHTKQNQHKIFDYLIPLFSNIFLYLLFLQKSKNDLNIIFNVISDCETVNLQRTHSEIFFAGDKTVDDISTF